MGVDRNAARVAEWPNDVLPCVPDEWETTSLAPPGTDPLALAFWHLARVEEAQPDVQRDAHGRTAYAGSWTAGKGDDPLDAPVDRVRELVRRWAHAHGVETASIWPGGRRFALALSHDVDGLRRLTKSGAQARRLKRAVRSIGRREGGDAAKRRQERRGLPARAVTRPLLDVRPRAGHGAGRDATSTYYFLAGPRCPRTARTRRRTRSSCPRPGRTEGGDEIGLHASYDLDETPGLVQAERLRLAGLSEDVPDVRYHYLRFDPHRHARELVDSGVTRTPLSAGRSGPASAAASRSRTASTTSAASGRTTSSRCRWC